MSYIAGILCSGLVGSKLSAWTGYSDKPLDAIGAVIISALAVKILTFLNNQDRLAGGADNAPGRFRWY
nr:MAG TPA: holin [Caudoviricetes sp.]